MNRSAASGRWLAAGPLLDALGALKDVARIADRNR